jgi:hypothetical protein
MIKADAKLPPRKHFFSATQQPLIKRKKLIAFLSLVGAKEALRICWKNLASPREARFLLVSLLLWWNFVVLLGMKFELLGHKECKVCAAVVDCVINFHFSPVTRRDTAGGAIKLCLDVIILSKSCVCFLILLVLRLDVSH